MYEIKGKTVDDLLRMPQEEWLNLGRADMAKVVRRLADAANKRIDRFDKMGEYSPATRAAERSGGRFGTKGKSINQLRHEYVRAKSFLTAETSTAKGWHDVKERTIKSFEKGTGVTIPYDKFNEFWEAYEKLRDLDPDIVNRAIRYSVIEELVQKLLKGEPVDQIISDMHGRISEIYKESQQERSEHGGTAKYFKGQ